MTSHRRLGVAGAALGVLTFATPAFAQDAPETTQMFDPLGRILTVEGDAHCDQFALGSEITELEENDPGEEFSLEGPDGQEVTAAIADRVNLEWQATVPVNFVIVGGRGDHSGDVSNVYVFGEDPALFDRGETAPNISAIRQVRFCYGLFEEPEPLPRCADIEDGPQCPIDDEEAERNGTLVFFDFDRLDFGADAKECVCGSTELIDCDEGLPAGAEGTCAGGELSAVEVVYVATKNPDSKICKSIDGRRICRTTRR